MSAKCRHDFPQPPRSWHNAKNVAYSGGYGEAAVDREVLSRGRTRLIKREVKNPHGSRHQDNDNLQ